MNKLETREFYAIVLGGSILSFNAAYINVCAMAGAYSATVSHVTGNITRMGISVFNEDLTIFALVASIVGAFMFGSFVAGFMVGDSKFRLGHSYGYALLLESFALLAAYIFIRSELVIGEWIAAFACGLQNALATSFSGFTVRTTHMTGIVTGILLFIISRHWKYPRTSMQNRYSKFRVVEVKGFCPVVAVLYIRGCNWTVGIFWNETKCG